MKSTDRNLEFDLARNVLALGNRIVASRNNHLKELGLTAEQADTLLFFAQTESATATDLKHYLKIRHQTARGIIGRLADKGLVALTISAADARAKVVTLTNQGLQTVETLRENGTHTGYNLLKGMDQAEQAQFAALIARALENI